MNLDDRYVRLDGLLWFPVDGGSWIVRHMEEDKFFSVEKDGKEIFELLDGSRTVKEIIDITSGESNISKEQATEELTAFFENLLDLGLIVPVEKMKED